MAASGKRAGKTNVFWSKDPNDQDDKILKLHMPGMLLEPHTNVKMPMVRKPVHMIKPRVVTLQKSSHNSLEKKCFPLKTSSSYTNQKRDSNDSNSASYQRQLILGERPKREQGRNTKEFTLKELNPQDKKRVANLVKELAKVGEERVYAEEKLQEERMAFEERLAILQEEYDAVIKEKHHLQKRFVELQELLVKYQSNGRTPSPRKPVKSVAYEQKEIHQVSGDVSSIPPSAPSNSLPSKPELTEIPGNTRPNTSSTETVSEKLSSKSQLPLPVIAPQERIDSAPHEKSEPLHQLSSFPLSQPRESVRGKSSLSPQAKQIAEGVLGGCPPVATHTNGKETSQSRDQTVIIPHTTPGDVPALNSSNLRETSLNTSSSVTGGYHVPSSIPQSQPAVQHGPTVMSQYPTHEKHVFSVFGGSEPRIPPRKNEDRSFSEASGVSGNFSAELDAVYRLYCREYELQLQLQQQQIELQKQQLQLQQQLQQVETLQQQQQQQQQEQQQQQQQQQQPPSSVKSPKHVLTAGQALTGRMNQPITVVEETPAPSPLPRPASQPRQVSPARSLIPTPEGSSSILSNGRFLPGADVQGSRAESSVGTFVSCAPSEAEMSRGRASNRVDLGKENRDPVVPDSHERVMSAPPSLPHSRQILEHYQEPRYQHEFIVPSTHSNYVRYSRKDNTQASSQRMNGTLDVVYHNDGLLSSRSSCHSNHTDASLRERKDEDFYVVPNLFSGRASSNLFHPNVDQESAVERGESIAERLQTDEGSNTQLAFLEPHSANPYRPTGSLNREISDSDQRFSLYSEVHSRYGRIPLDSGYPLSVVDIVDGLEGEKHIAPCGNAVVADGLDTSDSGYSQDTYKGTSPLTSDTVNTDEEEAAVLEDIFFLKGRM